MNAAWHQEIAGAFWRRRSQDRRRVFGKANIGHPLAHVGNHLGAGDNVLVQGLAAQVEEAVFQAHILGILGLAEHRQRQFLGGGQDFDLLGENLDLTGPEIRVDGVGHAFLDHAVNTDHPFAANLFSRREGRRIGVGDNLGQSVVITKVDEQHATMVAHAVYPARQADIGAGVAFSQSGAGVGTVGMHGISSMAWTNGWNRRIGGLRNRLASPPRRTVKIARKSA